MRRRQARDKSLCKNRPYVEDAIKQFERLLIAGIVAFGNVYPDLNLRRGDAPAKIMKFKVIVPKTNGGSRSGVRYVCELLEIEGEAWALCLGVYMHEGQDSEQMRRTSYRGRFAGTDIAIIESLEVQHDR